MIPVALAFTPNYFIPASVLVSSILDNSDSQFLFICLLSEDIPERQRILLESLCKDRATFRFLPISELPDGVYTSPRYSAAAQYRLLLPELLPELDKILYVDCDMIIRKDIGQLYDKLHFDRELVAAVFEAPVENQSARWKAIGCDPAHYFNSGFLMMNLSLMREERTSSKFIDALKKDYLEFPDQDVLNQVCQGRVLPLEPYWNGIRTFLIPQFKEDFLKCYGEDDWLEVNGKGNIHYTGGKPWNIFSAGFGIWWKQYYRLPVEFRSEWKPSARIHFLAAFYLTTAGKNMVDGMQAFHRKIRYRG